MYNALHGTHLDLSTELTPLKLEQALYTKLSNDVSCLIDNKIIVLAEHQSTINENMPRQGMYFRVHSLTSSFRLAPKTSLLLETTAIRGGTEKTFANRRSRYKAPSKFQPEAYL